MTEGPKLGEILVARGLVAREDVAGVLAAPGPGRLASELLRLGVASERALALGLAEQRGHPAVVLSESSLDLSALELVPRVIAEQSRLLPIAVDADSITIAVAELLTKDGRRPAIFDQLEFATGRKPIFYLAVDVVIAEATAMAYEAHRAGETVLVGQMQRPDGEPAHSPLSIVKPPSSALPTTQDPLFAPSDFPGADMPVAMGTVDALPGDEPLVTGTPAVPQKPLVFIVDDEDDIRTLLKKVLSHDGYHVEEARAGREAMEKLRTLRPSLVVLDAMLPEVHGFEICQTLKRSETFANTPVIVVTAVYKGWEHARTVQEVHGADAFVEKPFDVHYLRQLAARMIGAELVKQPIGPEWQRQVRQLRDEASQAYARGDGRMAEEIIKKWRALDPFDASAHLLLGNVKTKAGDLDNAMKAYERAATFDGSMFAAFKNLAVVYDQLGFTQRAQMAWYRAYELAADDTTRRRIEERLARR